MRRISEWLTAEIVRVRGVAIRRLHGAALIVAIAIAVIVIFAVGVLVGYRYPYHTRPAPPVPPGQTVPHCGSNPNDHSMGSCLPQPKVVNQASITSTSQGPDFSNNNPVSCSQMAAVASHNAFVILKANEGTGYVDPTAAGMSACARVHHLVVGGYDFLHVCLVSPLAEAHLFVVRLVADRLTGPGTLPPTGDAEYPSSPQCNARAWIAAWAGAVAAGVHRWPMIYTGAWWWNPHVGAWWLTAALSWVAAYTSYPPPLPAGLAHMDLWQFSSSAYNGATSADLSLWRDGAKAFEALTQGTPVQRYAIFPTIVFRFGKDHASERNTVRTWDTAHCRNPVRRPVCRTTRRHLELLRGRISYVAHHHLVRSRWMPLAKPRWSYPNRRQPLGSRFQLISHRLR